LLKVNILFLKITKYFSKIQLKTLNFRTILKLNPNIYKRKKTIKCMIEWEQPVGPAKLDEKDKKVLNYVLEHGRASLTEISKKTGVKIDSVKRRLERFEKFGIIASWKAIVWYKALGYPLATYINIKLSHYSAEGYKEFLNFLTKHRNVTDVVSVSGNYDLLIYILAKNRLDLDNIVQEIRQKFKDIIADWNSVTVVQSHKFDKFSFD